MLARPPLIRDRTVQDRTVLDRTVQDRMVLDRTVQDRMVPHIWPAFGQMWVFALLLVLLTGATFAADNPFSTPKTPTVILAPLGPISLAPGKTAKVELDFRVESGFHINSNTPKSDLLLPTVLRLSPPSDVVLSRISYPPGQDLSFEFLPGEKLNVYTGDFSVKAVVSTARPVSPGTYRVHGALRYQACDQRQCFPPKELPVSFDVKVQDPKRPPARNPGQSPDVH